MKILMVCLGNICRSPLAEGIMQKKLRKYFTNAIVDSAGTGGWHVRELPDKRSIAVAKKHGIDISKQRARQINSADFENFDFIFTMDKQVHQDVLKLTTDAEQQSKVHLLMNYAEDTLSAIVPDPYYGNEKEFEEVFVMLERACSVIAAKIIRK